MIAVAQGVVPVLVKFLDSSSIEMKEKVVSLISRISLVDSSKHVVIADGLLLLNHLLRVLDFRSAFAKEKACVALQVLTFSKENAQAIGSRGGISLLLEICQVGIPGSQAFATGVLRNLTLFSEIKENFVEENGVGVLLGVVNFGTALAEENAIGCLCNLVFDDKIFKLLVFREDGVQCLMNFWDSNNNNNRVQCLCSCPMNSARGVGPGKKKKKGKMQDHFNYPNAHWMLCNLAFVKANVSNPSPFRREFNEFRPLYYYK